MTDMLRVFKSLADPTRLRIVRLLLRKDLCVCELMFILEMAQSRISHQLRILRDAGLVKDIRDGQWIIYHLPENVRTTIAPLLGLFDGGKSPDGGDPSDQCRLDDCLKEAIRKKKCSSPGRASTRPGVRPAGK